MYVCETSCLMTVNFFHFSVTHVLEHLGMDDPVGSSFVVVMEV
jgi:hypothetical protein